MEQFTRDSQEVLDKYLSGAYGEATLMKDGNAWPHYKGSYRASGHGQTPEQQEARAMKTYAAQLLREMPSRFNDEAKQNASIRKLIKKRMTEKCEL